MQRLCCARPGTARATATLPLRPPPAWRGPQRISANGTAHKKVPHPLHIKTRLVKGVGLGPASGRTPAASWAASSPVAMPKPQTKAAVSRGARSRAQAPTASGAVRRQSNADAHIPPDSQLRLLKQQPKQSEFALLLLGGLLQRSHAISNGSSSSSSSSTDSNSAAVLDVVLCPAKDGSRGPEFWSADLKRCICSMASMRKHVFSLDFKSFLTVMGYQGIAHLAQEAGVTVLEDGGWGDLNDALRDTCGQARGLRLRLSVLHGGAGQALRVTYQGLVQGKPAQQASMPVLTACDMALLCAAPKSSPARSVLLDLHNRALRQGCSTFEAQLVTTGSSASAEGVQLLLTVEVPGEVSPAVIDVVQLAAAVHFKGLKVLLACLLGQPALISLTKATIRPVQCYLDKLTAQDGMMKAPTGSVKRIRIEMSGASPASFILHV